MVDGSRPFNVPAAVLRGLAYGSSPDQDKREASRIDRAFGIKPEVRQEFAEAMKDGPFEVVNFHSHPDNYFDGKRYALTPRIVPPVRPDLRRSCAEASSCSSCICFSSASRSSR